MTVISHKNTSDFISLSKEFNNISNFKVTGSSYCKFFAEETLSDEVIRRLEKAHSCDIFQLPHEIFEICWDPAIPKVAVFDLDSTLIQMEVIDTLAASKPEIGDQVAKITEESMSGRIDFRESLTRRVALLEGIDIDLQWKHIKETVKFTPGAVELFKRVFCKENGWITAVISGGFVPIAEWVRDQLNLTFAYANALETDPQTGLLTGKLLPNHPVVDSQAKEHHLLNLVQQHEAKLSVAVGDGANDLLMLGKATVGIAFNAKPIVQESAKFRLNTGNIYSIYHILKQEE